MIAHRQINHLRVNIGPHIQKCHFVITEELLNDFAQYGNFIQKGRNGYYVDLRSILIAQLLTYGIGYDNIAATTECTYCQSERYFSFRRDKVARNILAFTWQYRL
ncbi:MAG TPA: laccase domain-containing protein [bacterium]|nr:laccase domain-containing protein [bacterium]